MVYVLSFTEFGMPICENIKSEIHAVLKLPCARYLDW